MIPPGCVLRPAVRSDLPDVVRLVRGLAEGNAGDITWNFEKFLLSPQGDVVARYRPQVEPEDPTIIADIEAQLTA